MRFKVKAYGTSQNGAASVLQLEVEATSAQAAARQVSEQGHAVLSVRAQGLSLSWGAAGFTQSAALLFCQELLALLEAGMGLMESLDILCQKARDPIVRQVLLSVQERVREGRTFSEALETTPSIAGRPPFSTLLVATVRSAEQTGQISQALKRYVAYQGELTAVRDKVVAACVYPALLLIVGALVIVFLMTYVVPRFSHIYEDVGSENLPLLSRWLMQWGLLMNDHLGSFAVVFVAVTAGLIYALSRPPIKAWLSQKLWALPTVGEYLRTYQLAQFVRTLAMLLGGGIPLVKALDMTHDLLPQPALATGLVNARQAIAEGQSLSEAFRQNGLATSVGVRLLVVGERGGDLAQVMERIAAFYDAEVARAVAWFSRLFEPILMMVIGLVIGGVIILMYLPIFELAGSIQ
ncbi:type II secretion system F family protein [Limnohabitans sp.]|uniref:type II secretion system F family protein n=1 Tax=Limnohabitans sp. TaxID=1907725 RepID=UPI00286F6F2D|nr:type II secretion system F family protein [Limnohabitans sp.]